MEETSVPGPVGEACAAKFQRILQRNPGLETIRKLNAVLLGDQEQTCELPPLAIASFKYAPLTTCSVERAFSVVKNIYRDDRRSFTVPNLEKYIVVKSFT